MTVKIIPIFERAREIKPDGADIVEVLQSYSIEEIREQILGSENERETDRENNQRDISDNCDSGIPDSNDNDSPYPFQILGIADDGRAYFLCYEGRMVGYDLISLNKNRLINLGGLEFFKQIYGGNPKTNDWDLEMDAIMHLSKKKDFDLEMVKGRGAWRTRRGDICYYDGKKITGTPDKRWSFVRKNEKTCGLEYYPASGELRKSVMEISKRFTLRTSCDNVRLLSWASLAHFGGALKWRPMIMATGDSGTGKTTVMDNIVFPIAKYNRVNGTTTTEAAIRQYNGLDSYPVAVEEAERSKPSDKERIEGIFALARGSTTDDSPMTIKGSSNGVAVKYEMKSMFAFTCINPSIDNTADDNRIIRINFEKPRNKEGFLKDIAELQSILTDENCDKIRSFVWKQLPDIIKLGDRLFITIQKITGKDARFAAGESILLAANLIVWENMTHHLADDFLDDYVTDFYRSQMLEMVRDETVELIERLLDEVVIVGETRENFSLRAMLVEMKKYIDSNHLTNIGKWQEKGRIGDTISPEVFNLFKKTVEQYGLTVHNQTRELAICHNHHKIMKIINMGKSFHRQFERHQRCIEYSNMKNPPISIDSGTKRVTLMSGFLDYDKFDEELGEAF